MCLRIVGIILPCGKGKQHNSNSNHRSLYPLKGFKPMVKQRRQNGQRNGYEEFRRHHKLLFFCLVPIEVRIGLIIADFFGK
jgi:hypothetical protein